MADVLLLDGERGHLVEVNPTRAQLLTCRAGSAKHGRLPNQPFLQPILSVRAHIGEPGVNSYIRAGLYRVESYMTEQHIHAAGPPFVIRRYLSRGVVDVEVGWPVDHLMEGTGNVHGGLIPVHVVRTSIGDRISHMCGPKGVEDGLEAFE
jgi:hypothetical protein